jgi:tRNA G18 (ribose-2'-O)-methylase SpoU
MPIVPIDDAADPRLASYRNVPDPALVRSAGLFVAEGRLVVARLLGEARLTTRSMLVTRPALAALEERAVVIRPDLPVYVVAQTVMNDVTGFHIHRGCLALGERPPARDWREICPPWPAGRPRWPIVVLERLGDADNIGSIFRSAAALGAGGVLLAPGCADPFYRKAIRTSMGASLSVPFADAAPWPGVLAELYAIGIATIAMTVAAGTPPLHEVVTALGRRTDALAGAAIVVGHEGDGLSEGALAHCSHRARVEMEPGIDSLNVATAAALALYELRSNR